MIREARAQYFPTVTANPGITNSRLSTAFGQTVGTTFTTSRCRWKLPGSPIYGAAFETP